MKKNNNFVLRNIYGKKVLVPTKANEVGDDPILMNDVGAHIWCEAEKADSADDLVKNLLIQYGLQEDSIEQHAIKEFVQNLLDMKLIYD